MHSVVKRLRYIGEALATYALFALFRALPLDKASHLGGVLALTFSRFTRKDAVVRRNLEIVFPDMLQEEREEIRAKSWRHMGQVLAEMSHLKGPELLHRITYRGIEQIPVGAKIIFVSAHTGQWELAGPVADAYGMRPALVYRHMNNPYAEGMLSRLRGAHSAELIPKGHRGATRLIRALKANIPLAMLVDQKMNNGIPVNFFGRQVMAAPAFAQFAQRYDMAVVPARVVRKEGAHFEAIIYPPLYPAKSGDDAADAAELLQRVYTMIEGWIREHPGQYLWMHRRFDKSLY